MFKQKQDHTSTLCVCACACVRSAHASAAANAYQADTLDHCATKSLTTRTNVSEITQQNQRQQTHKSSRKQH